MSRRGISRLAIVYFAAMTIATTFPGIQPVNRIRPLILGVPFVFTWYLIWIVGAVTMFFFLHRVYSK